MAADGYVAGFAIGGQGEGVNGPPAFSEDAPAQGVDVVGIQSARGVVPDPDDLVIAGGQELPAAGGERQHVAGSQAGAGFHNQAGLEDLAPCRLFGRRDGFLVPSRTSQSQEQEDSKNRPGMSNHTNAREEVGKGFRVQVFVPG